MSEPTEKSTINRRVEFFDTAICQPPGRFKKYTTSKTEGFAGLEVHHWVVLAEQIGYIDRMAARALANSTWQILLTAMDSFGYRGDKIPNGKSISDSLQRLLLSDDGPRHVYDDEHRHAVFNVFQSVLQLVSENLFDVESIDWFDVIGWHESSDWNTSLKNENGKVNFQGLASGFANAITFLEGLGSLSSDSRLFINGQPQLGEGGKLQQPEIVHYLLEKTSEIVRPRFNLEEPEVWRRYVAFGGDFVKRTDDGTPEWHDAARNSFEGLLALLRFVGKQPLTNDELWPVFRAGTSPKALGRRGDGAQQSGAW